jgi:DNA-binding NarL/FixJ family response regulator
MTTEISATLATAVRPSAIKNVLVCDTHPLTAVGVKTLLSERTELRFAGSAGTLLEALNAMRDKSVDLLVVDKAFGSTAICELTARLREEIVAPNIVVWGGVMSAADTIRPLRAGVRGVSSQDGRAFGLGVMPADGCTRPNLDGGLYFS